MWLLGIFVHESRILLLQQLVQLFLLVFLFHLKALHASYICMRYWPPGFSLLGNTFQIPKPRIKNTTLHVDTSNCSNSQLGRVAKTHAVSLLIAWVKVPGLESLINPTAIAFPLVAANNARVPEATWKLELVKQEVQPEPPCHPRSASPSAKKYSLTIRLWERKKTWA